MENLSRKFHEIYQLEAKRQSDLGTDKVRHPDNYDELPERTKEYDRVLARHVLILLAEVRAQEREKCIKVAQLFGITGSSNCLPDCNCRCSYEIAQSIRQRNE